MSAFGSLLHGGRVEQADYDLLAAKLYFHGSDSKDAYVRFAVQLVLSAVIATGGVIGDSTAVVIGAMIIAPLMVPIMATAFAVVAGDAEGLVRSVAPRGRRRRVGDRHRVGVRPPHRARGARCLGQHPGGVADPTPVWSTSSWRSRRVRSGPSR